MYDQEIKSLLAYLKIRLFINYIILYLIDTLNIIFK